jgi:hypothetical protein
MPLIQIAVSLLISSNQCRRSGVLCFHSDVVLLSNLDALEINHVCARLRKGVERCKTNLLQ